MPQYFNHGSLTDVPGFSVGHSTLREEATGCTVVLCEASATVGVDISGGAPGTRETALLNPTCFVEKADGILLTGGSAFGLAAADGVMRFLAENGRGVTTPHRPIPIVPSAVLYDLNLGSSDAYPKPEDGYLAASKASSSPVKEGSFGAGTGALVGKVRGPKHAVKGGLGSASITLDSGVVVGALAVVNAFGDIVDPVDGSIKAGAKAEDGSFLNTEQYMLGGKQLYTGFTQNTTLCVIATNCRISKIDAIRVSQMAQTGLARTVVPSRTQYDGDIVFTMAHGDFQMDINAVNKSYIAWGFRCPSNKPSRN